MKPSIKKVIRDLVSNKSRSLTVLLAIVLGAFGVSMMTTAYNLLGKNLKDNYLKTNPASFTIITDSCSDNILKELELLPYIEDVETRNKLIGRVEINKNEFVPIWLFIVDDFEKVKINTFRLVNGTLPVSGNEILIERTGNRLTDVSLNKQYPLTIPGFGVTNQKISGIVHDPGLAPSWMEGLLYGYVSTDFINKMKITVIQPELKFTVRYNKYDLQTIEERLMQTVSFLNNNNIEVIRTEILTPGRHIHQSQMDSLMFLLQMFGVLALFLSCFLIINMVMAIMAKETRQIGAMKAIGAGTGKITSIYLAIVLIFGLIASLIALPVGFSAGKAYAVFVAEMLNFELYNKQLSPAIWLLQIAIGTLLPAIVAFFPIYRSSRISVREALNDYGVKDNVSLSSNPSKKFFNHIRLSKITLFAMRNTFRRKGRLVLTLITLTLGGAIFITAFNIRASLKDTVDNRFTNQHYDIQTIFAKKLNEAEFCSSIDQLPLVSQYEVWGNSKATRIISGHSESELIELKVAPLQTKLFVPEIMKGQWLSGNPDEVVINHVFLAKYPDVKAGSKITLKMNGNNKEVNVVGIIRELFSGPAAYVNNSILKEWPQKQGEINSSLLIAFNSAEYPNMADNSAQLEQWLKSANYPASLAFRKDQYKERVVEHLVVITTMLIMVTILLIIVGGLGLITTMGINIIERLRELAILKAIGVTNQTLYRLTLTEGFIIGLLSWVIAVVVSVPVSYYLGNKFFNIFFETSLNFKISITGIILWMGIIVLFSAIAVLVPSQKANKQSVAQGLTYE